MKPKLKLGLVISETRPQSVFKNRGKLDTSAGPGDGITAKRDRAKILGCMSHSCVARQGAIHVKQSPTFGAASARQAIGERYPIDE